MPDFDTGLVAPGPFNSPLPNSGVSNTWLPDFNDGFTAVPLTPVSRLATGTPYLIGTNTAGNTALTQTITVSAGTSLGDSIFIMCGEATSSVGTAIIISVTDSKGNIYRPGPFFNSFLGTTGQPAFSYTCINSRNVLTTSDTITVTWNRTSTAKNCIAVGVPGTAPHFSAIDKALATNATGVNNLSLSTGTLQWPQETIIVMFNSGNAGGSPALSPASPGFIQLAQQTPGSAQITTVGYIQVSEATSLTVSQTLSANTQQSIILISIPGIAQSDPTAFDHSTLVPPGFFTSPANMRFQEPFNPSLNIAGPPASNITVSAIPGSVLITISGTVIPVTASSIPGMPGVKLPGAVSAVSVTAHPGSFANNQIGAVTNISVTAVSGSSSVNIHGPALSVNITARPGIPKITVPGASSSVNAASTGKVTINSKGTVISVVASPRIGTVTIHPSALSNIAVNSTGKVTLSSSAVSHVTVAAPAGTKRITVTGVAGHVNSATSGKVRISSPGAPSSVTVTPHAGNVIIRSSALASHVLAGTKPGDISTNVPGSTLHTTVTAIPGRVNVRVGASASVIRVATHPGIAGQLIITASLDDPDINFEAALSEEGKLLSIPPEDKLISETKP